MESNHHARSEDLGSKLGTHYEVDSISPSFLEGQGLRFVHCYIVSGKGQLPIVSQIVGHSKTHHRFPIDTSSKVRRVSLYCVNKGLRIHARYYAAKCGNDLPDLSRIFLCTLTSCPTS